MLKDKIVLITGSSIGIGKETALQFAKKGSEVIVTYYQDDQEAKKVYSRCKKLSNKDGLLLKLNLKDNISIKKVIDKIIEKYGKIDVLVNNAGVVYLKELQNQTFDEIENQNES